MVPLSVKKDANGEKKFNNVGMFLMLNQCATDYYYPKWVKTEYPQNV